MFLIDTLVILVEFYIFTTFFKSVFNMPEIYYSNRGRWYRNIGIILLIHLIGIQLIRNYTAIIPLVIMMYTMFILVALSLCYKGTFNSRAIYVTALVLLGSGSEMAVGLMFSNTLNEASPAFLTHNFNYLVGLITSKLVFFFSSRILAYFCRKEKSEMPFAFGFAFVLLPFISIIVLFIVVGHTANLIPPSETVPIFIVVGILIMNMMVYIIYDFLSWQYHQLLESKIRLSSLKYSQKQNEMLIAQGEKIAGLAHDAKKHIELIRMMLEDNNTEKCLSYLHEITSEYDSLLFEDLVLTNIALNIILNLKKSQAESRGIKFDASINTNAFYPLSDSELSILFGNALDNAIEACSALDGEKYINLSIEKIMNRLSIKIVNSSSDVEINEAGFVKTTKKDAALSGNGLRLIKNVVDRHNGNFLISYSNNEFTLITIFFL